MVAMDKETGKKYAAEAALEYIEDDMIIGVGSGIDRRSFYSCT